MRTTVHSSTHCPSTGKNKTDTFRYPLLFAYDLEAVCDAGVHTVAAVVAGTGIVITGAH